MSFRYFAVALAALVVGSTTSVARAQVSSQAKAAAEIQFDEGLALMKAGRFTEACSKLESSQRVEPAVGTSLYLGECYIRIGRTASAWAIFREASSLATATNQPERAKLGKKRAEELEPKLAFLTLVLPKSAQEVEGLTILRNGEPMERSLFGTAIPVDPGPIRVEVTAKGYEPFVANLEIAAASRTSIEIPTFRASTAPEPSRLDASNSEVPSLPQPTTASVLSPPHVDTARVESGSARRTIGLVVGAAGLVGVGVGSYFGLRAMSRNSDAEAGSCDEAVCQRASDLELVDSARRDATISNVLFATGGVAIATGAVLYWLAPSPKASALRVHPRIGKGELSLAIGGTL